MDSSPVSIVGLFIFYSFQDKVQEGLAVLEQEFSKRRKLALSSKNGAKNSA
jgi:hypothetical protein